MNAFNTFSRHDVKQFCFSLLQLSLADLKQDADRSVQQQAASKHRPLMLRASTWRCVADVFKRPEM
jgi:hypothetical protein